MVKEQIMQIENILTHIVPTMGPNILKKVILDLGVNLDIAGQNEIRNIILEVTRRVDHFFGPEKAEILQKNLRKVMMLNKG